MADVYLDSDVGVELARALSDHGHTARLAATEGMRDAGDPAQLLHAAERGWVLISHNKKDFRDLHDAWLRWAGAWGALRNHAGILILEQVYPIASIAPGLSQFLHDHQSLQNQLYEWTQGGGWRAGRRLRPPI